MTTGGQYLSEKTPRGWNVYDVPFFAEHDRFGNEFSRAWLDRAVAQSSAEEAAYLGPVHVQHHEPGPSPQVGVRRAGFFRPRRVEERSYPWSAGPVAVAICDLIELDDWTYEEIAAGKLPYVSVEIRGDAFPVDKACFNSIALLPNEAPYFRFPLLTIGAELAVTGAEADQPMQLERLAASAPTIACYSSPSGWSALFSFAADVEGDDKGETGDDTGTEARSLISRAEKAGFTLVEIAKATNRDTSIIGSIKSGEIKNPPTDFRDALKKLIAKGKKDDDMAANSPAAGAYMADEMDAAKAANIAALQAFTDKLTSMTEAVGKLAEDLGLGDADPAAPEADPAPEPVVEPEPIPAAAAAPAEQPAPAQPLAASAPSASLELRLKVLEGELSRAKAERAQSVAVTSAAAEVSGYGAGDWTANLVAAYASGGDAGVANAVVIIKAGATPRPPETFTGEVPFGADDAATLAYASAGKAKLQEARRMAACYAASSRALIGSTTLADYISAQIGAPPVNGAASSRS